MLKKIKFKNSSILLIGIILICVGISIGFIEYFNQRKEKVYSTMNILLFENEEPQNVESDQELNENTDEYIEDNESNLQEQPEVPQQQEKYNYIGILEIPKINLKRGFLDLNSKYNNVDYNITVINGSTYPNEENNNLILAAHSGACKVCFFNKLYKLSVNDSAYLYYKNIKYYYKIVNIYEVEKDGTVPIYRDYSKNTLTLITCTRNSNTKQTVYILELYNKEKY